MKELMDPQSERVKELLVYNELHLIEIARPCITAV